MKSKMGSLFAILRGPKSEADKKAAADRLTRDALLLASVRDSVVVTDLDGVVTYWNDGATRLFGWAAERIKVPGVVGELMAGVVVGPFLLGHLVQVPLHGHWVPLSGRSSGAGPPRCSSGSTPAGPTASGSA